MRTAINLYSVRELDEPTLDVLDRVAEAGYDGVQFSGGLGDASVSEVRAALDDLDLAVTPPHISFWEFVEDDPSETIETYGTELGCDGLVAPSTSREHFESEESVREGATIINEVIEDLAEHDLDLHYHNHAHEFEEFDEETAYDRLAELAPQLLLELDVGWVLTGGQDPVSLLERYGDRITLVHMKDMTVDGEFAELGEGAVDLEGCVAAADDGAAEWLIYEHDEPADPAASIDTGAAVLDSLLDSI